MTATFATMSAHSGVLIGQLAKAAGVKTDTVRFYERAGLLPPASRTANGYRIYDEAAQNRIRFIKRAQALGFSLEEIRRILTLRGRGRETCECVVRMAEASLAEIEAKLRELQTFRDALATNLVRWRKAPRGNRAAEYCALIENSAAVNRSPAGGRPRSA